MIRAGCMGALVMMIVAGGIRTAHAQPSAPRTSLDVDACAKHLYERLARLARGRHSAERQATIVLRAIATADTCGLSDEWRDAARRGARNIDNDSVGALFARLTESHPDERCRTELSLTGRVSRYVHFDCRPAHPAIRDLVVSLGLERSYGRLRGFVVLVIDTLTASSPRLVAAAQALWTFANWDFRCVPSPVFIRIRSDLQSGTARYEAYASRPRGI